MTRVAGLASIAISLLLSACAGMDGRPVDAGLFGHPVEQALAARGHGRDALAMIDNLISYQGVALPWGVGPGVRRLLAQPLRSSDVARGIGLPEPFAVVAALDWAPPADLPPDVANFVSYLVTGFAAARERLWAGLPKDCCHPAALLAAVESTGRPAPELARLARGTDAAALDKAAVAVLGLDAAILAYFADGELARQLALLPASRVIESPMGHVVLAGLGDDTHEFGTIVVDVGGNDEYDMQALTTAGPSLIVDISGDDNYRGSSAAVIDVVITIDLQGSDMYQTPTSGVAAAIGGIALLHDLSGDDSYKAATFAQGAAIAGFAVLKDDGGNDRYRISWRGQGFGGPVGFGALLDADGDDDYGAKDGPADPFTRSGGLLGYAQGAGIGWRGTLAGGVGLLRDGGGNDIYRAPMFAQGAGYYFGFGVLDDHGGDDRYQGSRYGQGMGAHGGIGVLADADGADGYVMSVGVGQGMGLDLGVGVLQDTGIAGDRYQAATLAQGASTSNGFGLLEDAGGGDIYALSGIGEGWGRAVPARGLPGLPFLIDADGNASFQLDGEPLAEAAQGLGGPMANRDQELPPSPRHDCPVAGHDPHIYQPGDPVGDWLGRSAPLFGTADGVGLAYYAHLWATLPDSLPAMMAAVSPTDAALTTNLQTLLRCYLRFAEPMQAQTVLQYVTAAAVNNDTRQAGLAVALLRGAPPDPQTSLAVARVAQGNSVCSARAGAMSLARLGAGGEVSLAAPLRKLAIKGLSDPCWQTKAWALQLWKQVADGAILPPDVLATLPEVLRTRLGWPGATGPAVEPQ
ncbi:MAG: hypothetical protein QF670_01630 [Alphaproteobacteria bacterium]|nr:hypothetical protein [Alphaproteobacteria bacterium]